MANRHDRGGNGSYGMNWIRKERRLAIYLRDGLSCLWCGLTVEDGIQLTLDHAVPRSRHLNHASDNLFTACISCNGSRKHWSVATFAWTMAQRFDGLIPASTIVENIRYQLRQPVDVETAKAIIQRRGFKAALSLKNIA